MGERIYQIISHKFQVLTRVDYDTQCISMPPQHEKGHDEANHMYVFKVPTQHLHFLD